MGLRTVNEKHISGDTLMDGAASYELVNSVPVLDLIDDDVIEMQNDGKTGKRERETAYSPAGTSKNRMLQERANEKSQGQPQNEKSGKKNLMQAERQHAQNYKSHMNTHNRDRKQERYGHERISASDYHDNQQRLSQLKYNFELRHYRNKTNGYTAHSPVFESAIDYITLIMDYVPFYGSQLSSLGIKYPRQLDQHIEPVLRSVYSIALWAQRENLSLITDELIEFSLHKFLWAVRGYVFSNFGGHHGEPEGFLSIDDYIDYNASLDYFKPGHRLAVDFWHRHIERTPAVGIRRTSCSSNAREIKSKHPNGFGDRERRELLKDPQSVAMKQILQKRYLDHKIAADRAISFLRDKKG